MEELGKSTTVELRTSSVQGRHLFVPGTAAAEAVLLSVPLGQVLTAHRALGETPELAELGEDVPDRVVLLVYLILHRYVRQTNEWFTRLLPEHVPSAVALDDAALQPVANTPLYTAVQGKTRRLEQEFMALREPVQLLFGDAAVTWFTPERYLWADVVYRSRVMEGPFAGEGEEDDGQDQHVEAIVPGIDFCNHGSAPNARWQVRQGHVHLIANRALCNEEVLISYGDKGNQELMYQYGFALEDNPHDALVVPLASVAPSMGVAVKLMHIAQAKGCRPLIAFGKEDGPTNESYLFASLLAMDVDEVEAMDEREYDNILVSERAAKRVLLSILDDAAPPPAATAQQEESGEAGQQQYLAIYVKNLQATIAKARAILSS